MKRQNLIDIRKKHNLTQDEVAHRASIKRSYYGLIETGMRNPSLPKARNIARVFNKDVSELFPNEIFFNSKCYVK